ncbi:MAG: V-type ATPase subunit [Planctomycetaceae bacterium]|nr:V-type ATPase subunit [Planctomycetaceae bacterium]
MAELTYEIDFYRYPPIGSDNWKYAHAAARVGALDLSMIPRAMFLDMANAPSFADAAEMLSGTEYAIDGKADDAQIEQMLLERRTEVRNLFAELIDNESIEVFLRAREDFANMRLAVRRVVTGQKLGTDYSNDGNVPASEFEEIFEQENYERFPDYLQEAVEAAVLGYYEKHDIRRIDYEIDRVQAAWRIRQAQDINCEFCLSLMRLQIDLSNIRTMLRLKMAGRQEETDKFLPGGFVSLDRLRQGLEIGLEAIAGLFFTTPYYELLEISIPYLRSEQSFLRLEKECDDYVSGFLAQTRTIAAGPQPVIAYFLWKEAEIRTVRMVLTGKKNGLSPQLIQDRLGERMN